MPEHVHLCLSIPPKYSVAHTIGFLKGKSAVRIHRDLPRERRMTGLHFWATGYCVSTVGLDEQRWSISLPQTAPDKMDSVLVLGIAL